MLTYPLWLLALDTGQEHYKSFFLSTTSGPDIPYSGNFGEIIVCVPIALRIQIAKFNLRQYLLRANSPNLMLAKLSQNMVCYFDCACSSSVTVGKGHQLYTLITRVHVFCRARAQGTCPIRQQSYMQV